jgi:hypothetical protein
LGEPPKFSFIFGDGPIKMAHCKKQKENKTWNTTHLMNRRGD